MKKFFRWWNTPVSPSTTLNVFQGFYLFLLVVGIASIVLQGCETSEGLKYGTLQKVSHKKFPCDYYVAEFSFEGGKVTGNGKSRAYSNTQEVGISKAAYDTLQFYLGEKVIFDYKDKGFVVCGESKELTLLRRK